MQDTNRTLIDTEQAETGTHIEQGQGTHDIGQADKRHIAKIPLMMIHCPVNSLMTLTPMTALFWRVGGSKTRAGGMQTFAKLKRALASPTLDT